MTESSPTPAEPDTLASNEWGRVDSQGTVYLRTPTGERRVGSWQADAPEAALEFYGRRFEDLLVQVELLEQRLASGAASPQETGQAAQRLRETLDSAEVVGDVAAIAARLDAVDAEVRQHEEARRAQRAEAVAAGKARKEAIVSEAETLAAGEDWRNGADRFRALLDEWKTLPRLPRATDDALWHRFSSARTHYTRHRKAHFADVAQQRERAREAKEELARQAEALRDSTDWGPTAGRFRELMQQWKAAGPAGRGEEEALWRRFRTAQDAFFERRNAAFEEREAGQQENLAAKEALLVEAEALLPVRDWKKARADLRRISERWEAAGPVPRDKRRAIEQRFRAVEDAVTEAERSSWRRTNPEGRARAQSTVASLQTSIERLESELRTAQERGDARTAADKEEALAARRSWLVEAERALAEFGG